MQFWGSVRKKEIAQAPARGVNAAAVWLLLAAHYASDPAQFITAYAKLTEATCHQSAEVGTSVIKVQDFRAKGR